MKIDKEIKCLLNCDCEDDEEAKIAEYKMKLKLLNEVLNYIPVEKRKITVPSIFNSEFDERFLSDYLAYILNPNVNGLGVEPLKKIISKSNSKSINIDDFSYRQFDIEREYTFKEFNVQKRIDILIKIDDELIVAIENKINSSEKSGGTQDYFEAIKKEFPDYSYLLIFLTRGGEEPSSDEFEALSHEEMIEALKEINISLTSDIRKSILYKEYLLHMEEYIVKNRGVDLSEKTKLYFDNYEMIRNLTEAFENDREEILEYLEEKINNSDAYNNFEIKSTQKRGIHTKRAHQIYKKKWKQNKLFIHFEFYFNAEELFNMNRNGKFKFMLDVERYESDRFKQYFKKQYKKNKEKYIENNIKYDSERKFAVAYKKYDFSLDKDNLNYIFDKMLNDFAFLIELVDNAIEKYSS